MAVLFVLFAAVSFLKRIYTQATSSQNILKSRSFLYTAHGHLDRVIALLTLIKDIPSGSCFGGNRHGTGHQRMRRFSMQFVDDQRAAQESVL